MSSSPCKENEVSETDDLAVSGEQDLSNYAKMWPDRATTPSVRDIIGYRQTLPPDVPPVKVGELAGIRFGWDHHQHTVTSERYVQGVVAAHDQTKRVLLDELTKYLEEEPTNPEDAVQKIQWVNEWVKTQTRPSTPEQLFED